MKNYWESRRTVTRDFTGRPKVLRESDDGIHGGGAAKLYGEGMRSLSSGKDLREQRVACLSSDLPVWLLVRGT